MGGLPLAEFHPPRRRPLMRLVVGLLFSLGVLIAVLFPASLFWLPRTVTYRIEGGLLTVEARYSVFRERRRVFLTDVAGVDAVKLQGGRRVRGTALPGFCVGTFAYQELGEVWQATNCSPAALVVRGRGLEWPVVITPRDRRLFQQAIMAGAQLVSSPAPVREGEGMAILRWGLALAALVVPLFPVFFFAAPARLRYFVRPGELEVVGLVLRRRWPLAGVRVRRFRPTAALRLLGTAVPGYYAGLFRLGQKTVRVAATHLEEGVLVEGPRHLFVTPDDVEGFLAAVEEAGAVRVPS